MAYDLFDFTESLKRVNLDENVVERVLLGFGRSPEGYASWEGGFVFQAKDDGLRHGRYGFVFGWCDTTGWGCQDGAYVYWYEAEPDPLALAEAWQARMGFYGGEDFHALLAVADEHPIDLNRFVQGEIEA